MTTVERTQNTAASSVAWPMVGALVAGSSVFVAVLLITAVISSAVFTGAAAATFVWLLGSFIR